MNEEVEAYNSCVPRGENELIDKIELALLEMVDSGEYVEMELPTKHTFTKGLYAREITMYPSNRLTSQIHLKDHQFCVLQGEVAVKQGDEVVILRAGHHGITYKGTRRVLMVDDNAKEVVKWITFHPTDILPTGNSEEEVLEAVAKVWDEVIEKRINPLLEHRNNINTQSIENE